MSSSGKDSIFEESVTLPEIYLDMDGTIVDWMEGANKTLANAGKPEWSDPYWEKTYGNKKDDAVKWQYLNSNPRFWESLKFFDDGLKIWKFTRQYKPHILSACGSLAKNCKQGKMNWIKSNIAPKDLSGIHLVRREDKKKFAVDAQGNPAILIDDYIKNCREWESAGGIAIRVTTANDVIQKLRRLGF